MLSTRTMLRVVLVLFPLLFAAAPARAHEYLPDGLFDAQLQFRSNRSAGMSDGFFRIGAQVQPARLLFFGVEAGGPPLNHEGTVIHDCDDRVYWRERSWGSAWLGLRTQRLRVGIRFTRNLEDLGYPRCLVDDGNDTLKSVTSTSVGSNVTDHPGVMAEYRFSPALRAGVLYDHDFQMAAWVAYRFPRLQLSLEGGRASLPHAPFPSYTRTDFRLGLRFSPTGDLLARSRLHVRVDLGVVHTDFEPPMLWPPEQPNALLIRFMVAVLGR